MLEIKLKEGTKIRAKVVNWDDTVDKVTIMETPYGTCIVRDGDNQLERIEDFDITVITAESTEIGVEFILKLKETDVIITILKEIFPRTVNIAEQRSSEWIRIFRNGDTCRVKKEDLKIVDVEEVFDRGYVTMRVMLEDESIVDAVGFYSDEIWISTYEILGRTLKEAEKIRFDKDVAYLRS